MNAPLRHSESCYYPVAFAGWDHAEYEAIARVIASGHFTMGENVEAFESEFAAYHGMRHAIAVNSGSSANLIAVEALCPRINGRSAAVPALAWSTTYAPLVQNGFDLLLCDCDDTWNVNFIRGRPDLLMYCPILGNPARMDGIGHLAESIGRPLIIDNCESIGALDKHGNLCGTQGILNTFSMYHSHQLSAIEGGMILTDDDDLAYRCRLLRNHGWTRHVRPPKNFQDEYCFEEFGYNVRPLELHCAIAREQLKKLDQRIAARTANFFCFVRKTTTLPINIPEIAGKPSFFGIHFTLQSKEKRDALAKAFRAKRIDCRPPIAGSFRLQPYGKKCADQQTPNADRIHETGIMIGNPPWDGTHLIDHAVNVMMEVL